MTLKHKQLRTAQVLSWPPHELWQWSLRHTARSPLTWLAAATCAYLIWANDHPRANVNPFGKETSGEWLTAGYLAICAWQASALLRQARALAAPANATLWVGLVFTVASTLPLIARLGDDFPAWLIAGVHLYGMACAASLATTGKAARSLLYALVAVLPSRLSADIHPLRWLDAAPQAEPSLLQPTALAVLWLSIAAILVLRYPADEVRHPR